MHKEIIDNLFKESRKVAEFILKPLIISAEGIDTLVDQFRSIQKLISVLKMNDNQYKKAIDFMLKFINSLEITTKINFTTDMKQNYSYSYNYGTREGCLIDEKNFNDMIDFLQKNFLYTEYSDVFEYIILKN